MAEEKDPLKDIQENLSVLTNLKLMAEYSANALGNLVDKSKEINNAFGQTRQRIVEIETAISDAVPGIRKLGGNVNDVTNTISQSADALKRNVIITSEQTEKLYAAQKLLGDSAKEIVNTFADVGVGVEKIPEQLESSLQYIRSIGGNSKQIFGEVSSNMEQLNRYQFEGGVQGLTKMAAQASMLRFNMNETFQLADKVLDPEKAVEVASAFQRLGVAAGDLVDPFKLMNDSINDPSGIQTSLANVAKQFTYFDEKTKTFKINPQGVITLKNMEQQAGLTAGSLSKMGLAGAEADKRISAIKGIGLGLSEEDNQLLANISRMGEGGEYEIKVKDESGKEYYEKISNISQKQLDATLKEQKEGPKTLEDVARSQMSMTEVIQNDVKAIRDKVVYGIASTQPALEGVEGVRRLLTTFTGEISKMGSTKDVREETTKLYQNLVDLFKDYQSGKKGKGEATADFLEKFSQQFSGIGDKLKQGLVGAGGRITQNLTTKTSGEEYVKEQLTKMMGTLSGQFQAGPNGKPQIDMQTINSFLYGKEGVGNDLGNMTTKNMTMSWEGPNPKFDININNTNPNATPFTPQQMESLTKFFTDELNKAGFKDYIININQQQNPTKQPKPSTYGK